jgi:hypothetical protein
MIDCPDFPGKLNQIGWRLVEVELKKKYSDLDEATCRTKWKSLRRGLDSLTWCMQQEKTLGVDRFPSESYAEYFERLPGTELNNTSSTERTGIFEYMRSIQRLCNSGGHMLSLMVVAQRPAKYHSHARFAVQSEPYFEVLRPIMFSELDTATSLSCQCRLLILTIVTAGVMFSKYMPSSILSDVTFGMLLLSFFW